ncbi:hypothetical protein [uncultured Idiomarina sp.]|uniref:hypothetical protein n=1 Tax=uncultured Idiomarina sp. TaxID=352961 RepID=UPI0032B127D5|tara:strand:- start:770 stop:1159 length:390 start_codon:yes stop_codon:yes gene_type:complete
MANTDNIISMVAAGTITEFAVVSLDTNGKAVVATAGTDFKVIGVAQRGASAGDAVDILVHGVTRMIAGEAITFANTPILSATTAGKVQACESTDTTFYPIARALPNINQKVVADGEQFFALFTGPMSLV